VNDIGFDQIETGGTLKVAQVLLSARAEIVETNDVRALGQKRVAQVGAEKPGSSRDKDVPTFAILH
jgi:hypothetical protein